MRLNLNNIIFVFIFIFTLKFEILNNIILGVYVLFNFQEIKLKIQPLKLLFLPVIILILYFIIYNNLIYLKYLVYVFRFLIILFVLSNIFKNNKLKLSFVLEKIYYLHVVSILLCYIFPSLNNIFTSIFSYTGGSIDRVTGFIQGYEFVPYLVVTYLVYDYILLKKIITNKFTIKLLLGTLACLFSGRYSIVPLIILYSYIFFNKRNLVYKSTIFGFSSIIFINYFDKIFLNISNTFNLVYEIIVNGLDSDFSKYSRFSENSIDIDQQYNLSPITLFQEAITPFLSWQSYFFPSSYQVIDSGPSYMILNLGFLITIFLYVFYFKTIKLYTKKNVPVVVILIFISIDLKFRSLFVLFTTIWLIINHINYVKLINK